MYARIVAAEGRPEKVEESIAIMKERNAPSVSGQPGFHRGYWCIDRNSGRVMSALLVSTACVLAGTGKPVPGSRTRRSPAERRAEQTIIDAVMTPDVTDVTDTTAATVPSPAMRPAGYQMCLI